MKKLFQKLSPNPKNDILSGLTVSLALVPEAVAFAFVAGVDPLVGLYGAFIMGIVTSIFGGRPGMISGATGAMAVVMVHLVQKGNIVGDSLREPVSNLGLQWLLITLLFVGIFQILFGILKLGKFIHLVPHSVMMGFVNGLAIVIFLSQIGLFSEQIAGEKQWLSGEPLATMLFFVGLTILIIYLLSKLTKKIPSALIAIITVTVISLISDFDISTVGSFIRDGGGEGLKGSLPSFQIQIFSLLDTLSGYWSLILSTSLILAAIGLIESLMTLTLIDELTETKGKGNKESIAQGFGNLISGFFGGMGGCAMVGQSMINVSSGGKGRLSGIIASIALLCFILFASSLIEQIPIAALVGVMFIVVINTFAWSSFRIIGKIPLSDAFVLITVSIVTVWQDLAVGVIVGVIISSLVFAWKSATKIRARKHTKEDGTLVYEIWGPLFFGSIQSFQTKFNPKKDPKSIEIDFMESKIADHSGIEAVRLLVEKYLDAHKKIRIKHLSPECQLLLSKSNPSLNSIIQKDIDDPRYFVVTDQIPPIISTNSIID